MRASLAWLGVCGVLACGEGAAPRSAASPRTRDLIGDTYDGTPLSQYRLIPARSELPSLVGRLPPELRLLGGQRLLDSGGVVQVAQTVATPGLLGARQVPAVSGGGFLFWSREGVYRSRTFLGRLEPVQPLPFEVQHVAFGPGYVLLAGSEGGTRVIDWHTGNWRAPTPIGLVDVVAADDGRVLSELVFQRFTLSLDRNVTARDVQQELGGRVRSLSHDPLGFALEDGSLVEVSARGELSNVGVPPRGRDPHALPGGESALERAVTTGVLRDEERALFPHGSALVEVDLRSGQVRRRSSELLPGRQDCHLSEVGREQLLVCDGSGGVSVFGQVNRDAPVLEQTFARAARVTTGFGRVLVDHDCSGAKVPLSVCLRDVGGVWRTLNPPQLTPALAVGGAGGATSPAASTGGGGGGAAPGDGVEVLGYGLKEEGGAVAFLRIGGKELAYRDLTNGETVPLESSASFKPVGDTECRVHRGRQVRCLGPQGPFGFGADGKRRLSPFRFQWVAKAGERALAGDASGKLFQSLDFGGNWMEVDAPPHFDLRERATQCSAVGCRVGGWLRLGWPGTSPERRPAAEPVPLPARPGSSRPRLVCSELSAANVRGGQHLPGAFGWEPAARQATSSISSNATAQDPSDADLRGIMWSHPPGLLRFRYVDFLDAAAMVRTSQLAVGEWQAHLRAAGAPLPNVESLDPTQLQGTPVLARDGKIAGFVLALDASPVWIKAGRAQPLAFEGIFDAGAVTSAIAEGAGSVALLFDSGVVVRQGPSGKARSLQVPGASRASASPDALAISVQGELAVLRFDGSEPPSADYPAFAYREGKAVEALAPWSSLALSSDASCLNGDGFRAVVTLRRSWLRLERAGSSSSEEDGGMTASVRWSKERVCLESVELPDRSLELGERPLPTRVVASFTGKGAAQRLGSDEGAELRQPLRCVLSR